MTYTRTQNSELAQEFKPKDRDNVQQRCFDGGYSVNTDYVTGVLRGLPLVPIQLIVNYLLIFCVSGLFGCMR